MNKHAPNDIFAACIYGVSTTRFVFVYHGDHCSIRHDTILCIEVYQI